MRVALALVILVAVYALALGSADPLDLLTGALLAAALLLALRRVVFADPPSTSRSLGRRVLAFPRFALAVLWEVLRGTWQVSLVVVGLRPLGAPGIVAIPLGERTPTGVAASALALTLAPGECLVDVDWDERVMLVHVLDAGDPEAVRRQQAKLYESHQRSAFP